MREFEDFKPLIFLDKHTNHRIYTAHVEFSAMGEGRVLLCGIAFALLPVYASLRAFHLPCRSHRRGIWCVKGVWSPPDVVHQAEKKDAMQQVIVSRNDKEEVWVKTPTGHRLTECFFKAPDETLEELEHMGYPQLLHLYPPEAILVVRGLRRRRWRRFLWRREPGRSTG